MSNEKQDRDAFLTGVYEGDDDKVPGGLEGAVIRQFKDLTNDCRGKTARLRQLQSELGETQREIQSLSAKCTGFADLLWGEEKKRRDNEKTALAATAEAEAEAKRKAAEDAPPATTPATTTVERAAS